MSTERKQVLEMLAEGKISTADADRLLDKLAAFGSSSGGKETSGGSAAPSTPGAKPKHLRVVIDTKDGERVNIRVPMFLVRTGIKLPTMMPTKVSARLAARGVDLSQLGGLEGDELVDALREINVDVDSADGEKVRIFCE